MDTNTTYKSLINIQNELEVPKGQFNKFGNFYYRSCEDILAAVKPLLKKYELVLTITDEAILIIGDRYYVKATVRMGQGSDYIECSAFARETLTKKGMDAAQITGSASSYARKYALNGLFAIDDTKDPDHNEIGHAPKKANTSLRDKRISLLKTTAKKWDKGTETLVSDMLNGKKIDAISEEAFNDILSKLTE